MIETAYVAPWAFTDGALRRDVRFDVDADGRIANVGDANEPGDAPMRRSLGNALWLPGFVNAHSHAFQRGIRGQTHRRAPGENSFWSWRTAMYEAANTLDPDGLFNIIYSSGTTGVPKGIVHSHRTRQGLAKGLMNLGIAGDSITLITTPMYSNTTITTWWPTLCAGGTLVIERKFDARRSLQLIDDYAVNTAIFVPVQYDRMMRLEDFVTHVQF